MPQEPIQGLLDCTQYTTAQLLTILKEIAVNLQYRVIPNDYSDTAMRGGTRPTHQPPNP